MIIFVQLQPGFFKLQFDLSLNIRVVVYDLVQIVGHLRGVSRSFPRGVIYCVLVSYSTIFYSTVVCCIIYFLIIYTTVVCGHIVPGNGLTER